MTYYNDQPDMYDFYLDAEAEADRLEYLASLDEDYARQMWQNEQAAQGDRFIPENDVENPDATLVVAANGHVYWLSPGRESE